ncbi:MAG: hypothetical protein GY941_26495 [Planctomycetes bacterium]|nr:hypothetical protein [Planctomycetota bacterium]
MLDLYDGKLSCSVLRRESGSNARDLSGVKEVTITLGIINELQYYLMND